MINIASKEEYNHILNRGYFPLHNWRMFTLPIGLRIELQNELFGHLNIEQQNNKFYQLFYKHSIKNCAETGEPIYEHDGINRKNVFSVVNVSHIITKGSDRRMALDFRNANLIIKPIHDIWEYGTNLQRQKLNIFRSNQLIIKLLKNDYNIR